MPNFESPIHKAQYGRGGYCKVRPGQILNRRYKLVRRLGHGVFSTVWLATDLKEKYKRVAIKIHRSAQDFSEAALDEKKVYNQIMDSQAHHGVGKHKGNAGESHILKMLDFFKHDKHNCIVFDAMWKDLFYLIQQSKYKGLSLPLVRKIMRQVLKAVRVLHSVGVIHTDLKPENFLITKPRHNQPLLVRMGDLGNCCWVNKHFSDHIQTRDYRAPEVILGYPYSLQSDIFSIGVMFLELLVGVPIFSPRSGESNSVRNQMQLALMMRSLGNIPLHMLKRSRCASAYFTRRQKFRNLRSLRPLPFETLLRYKVRDRRELLLLCDLLRLLLTLDPAKRISASQALRHPWFGGKHAKLKKSKR